MRAQYLFWFGNLCGVTPREVDHLRIGDFYTLIMSVDAYHAAKKQANGG